jgi:hypothetical protein
MASWRADVESGRGEGVAPGAFGSGGESKEKNKNEEKKKKKKSEPGRRQVMDRRQETGT